MHLPHTNGGHFAFYINSDWRDGLLDKLIFSVNGNGCLVIVSCYSSSFLCDYNDYLFLVISS